MALSDSLYAFVCPNRSKLWRFTYRFDIDKKRLSPDRYPRLGIAVAWHRGGGAKLTLQQGRDRRAQLVPVSWTPGYRRFWNRTVKCGSASSRANSSAR
ncbi:hypothetical protein GCM10008023_35520 [Sphingomonas glacialis]|uniref:DUF4102 domain-containing protein n=1 Tax=Sphingomonas glacialis TaxID=658225 RepID=A0ABQ3LS97_9SPHN|nr:hypothetical protein [Sphingomonas glacialis]GHH23946.1 hypothetical protein GCM10008023_35520 [Sphingomonas glacialis]